MGLNGKSGRRKRIGTKKKISDELRFYFPVLFPRDDEYQFYQHVKQKISCLAELAEAQEDNKQQILDKLAVIDSFFLNLRSPDSFRSDDSNNVILQYDLNFEASTSGLLVGGFAGIDKGSTFEYYSRIEYLRSTNKKNP